MSILFELFLIFASEIVPVSQLNFYIMYRLMISFSKGDVKNSVWCKPNEYLLPNADEVCKVITSLSHLDPVITLCQIPVFSASEVLKDFELKDV